MERSRYNAVDLDSEFDQQELIFYLNGQLYNGVVYEMFQDYVDVEYDVVNGMKHGVETHFYPTGEVSLTIDYTYNYMHGLVTNYNQDGSIREQSVFKENLFVEQLI